MSEKTAPASKPTSSRRRRRGCLLLIVLFVLAIFGLWLFIYRSCFPYDEVEVKLYRVPQGERIVAVVVSGPNNPIALKLYSHYWCQSFTRFPDKSASITRDDYGSLGKFQWIEAERAGILVQRNDNNWFIYWFNPPKNRLAGWTLLTGRGEWIVNLTDADETQQLTEDIMRAMGFVEALKKPEPAVPNKQ